MALIHSSQNILNKELEEQLEFYVSHIIVAKEVKKLLEARLLLSNATTTKSTLSLPQVDVTHLEESLLEAMHSLRKLAIKRQLVNVAVTKSIQSVLLHKTSKNLFQTKGCNYIEILVGQQMKLMLDKSRILPSLRDSLSTQFSDLQTVEQRLRGRISLQQERISRIEDVIVDESREKKIEKAQLKINYIYKLSMLLTTFVTQYHQNHDTKTKIQLFKLCLKWRDARNLDYFKNKINQS